MAHFFVLNHYFNFYYMIFLFSFFFCLFVRQVAFLLRSKTSSAISMFNGLEKLLSSSDISHTFVYDTFRDYWNCVDFILNPHQSTLDLNGVSLVDSSSSFSSGSSSSSSSSSSSALSPSPSPSVLELLQKYKNSHHRLRNLLIDNPPSKNLLALTQAACKGGRAELGGVGLGMRLGLNQASSARLATVQTSHGVKVLVDLGAGNGFPGATFIAMNPHDARTWGVDIAEVRIGTASLYGSMFDESMFFAEELEKVPGTTGITILERLESQGKVGIHRGDLGSPTDCALLVKELARFLCGDGKGRNSRQQQEVCVHSFSESISPNCVVNYMNLIEDLERQSNAIVTVITLIDTNPALAYYTQEWARSSYNKFYRVYLKKSQVTYGGTNRYLAMWLRIGHRYPEPQAPTSKSRPTQSRIGGRNKRKVTHTQTFFHFHKFKIETFKVFLLHSFIYLLFIMEGVIVCIDPSH